MTSPHRKLAIAADQIKAVRAAIQKAQRDRSPFLPRSAAKLGWMLTSTLTDELCRRLEPFVAQKSSEALSAAAHAAIVHLIGSGAITVVDTSLAFAATGERSPPHRFYAPADLSRIGLAPAEAGEV